MRQFGEGFHGVQVAGLVVRPHHGDDRGVGVDHFAGPVHVEAAEAVDGDLHHGVAAAFEVLAEIEDGRMLDRGDHDLAAADRADVQRAQDGGVVALGAAGREDDLARIGAEERRHFRAALLDHLRQAAAELVDAGRVAVVFGEIRQHGGDGLRRGARGGVVVQIDDAFFALHGHASSTVSRSDRNSWSLP